MSEISIDKLSEKFNNHLRVEGNQRTIFSGKFGIGKTYFLSKFFQNRKAEYNTIIINPVNYVVSSNEDIFELIKADIVNDLFFTGKIEFTKLQKTKLFERLFLFAGEKPDTVIKFVSKLLAKVNPLFEFTDGYLDAMKELRKSFTEYSKELSKKEKSRQEELVEFVDSLEEKSGSIYEHNYITKVINTFLRELKGVDCTRKNVLIIDDLDRIDPEHIFRILNVLSAHNNHLTSENKFSFEHIIVVCDLDNIEKIFTHKYGVGVDFEGYIDKFFSTEVFEINNNEAILVFIDSINQRNNFSEGENQLINYLIKSFVSNGSLTIRKMMKYSFPVKYNNFILNEIQSLNKNYYSYDALRYISPKAKLYIDSSSFSFLKVLQLFSRLFGSLKNFEKNLNILNNSKQESHVFNEKRSMFYYLASQFFLANENGESLYIYMDISDDGFGRKYIQRLYNPRISIWGRTLSFAPPWNADNIYNGTESFFSTIVVKDSTSLNSLGNKDQVADSEIIGIILQIIRNCHSKKFLDKANIS